MRARATASAVVRGRGGGASLPSRGRPAASRPAEREPADPYAGGGARRALFERNRRGVALTPAGSALLEEARDLLSRAEQAAMITRAIGAGQRGRLRMSLTRSLTGGVAGEIVASYRSRYPEVDLTLTIASSREA
jgi:hypothetical protein